MPSKFTITGPGVDTSKASAALAVSAAINLATGAGVPREQRAAGEATFYVRDLRGDLVTRVDRNEDGSVSIYGSQS